MPTGWDLLLEWPVTAIIVFVVAVLAYEFWEKH